MLNVTKGIVLSGGSGSRLFPLTTVVNKQLLPVFDKPMIYYPISTLINLGISNICIISSKEYISFYKKLFSNALSLGLNISYETQDAPNGIAESFIICKEFIRNDPVALILGDNVFHRLPKITRFKNGATVFAYKVEDPERYGVVEFSKNGKAISIEEKPKSPKSNYAIPGLYFYDNDVVRRAEILEPSERGELEITDLNKSYLKDGKLNVIKLEDGIAWLDAGTPTALAQSSDYVQAVQERQGQKIACIEEDCLNAGFISKSNFLKLVSCMPKSDYKNYLLKRT